MALKNDGWGCQVRYFKKRRYITLSLCLCIGLSALPMSSQGQLRPVNIFNMIRH